LRLTCFLTFIQNKSTGARPAAHNASATFRAPAIELVRYAPARFVGIFVRRLGAIPTVQTQLELLSRTRGRLTFFYPLHVRIQV
jgi:hypothetical protein